MSSLQSLSIQNMCRTASRSLHTRRAGKERLSRSAIRSHKMRRHSHRIKCRRQITKKAEHISPRRRGGLLHKMQRSVSLVVLFPHHQKGIDKGEHVVRLCYIMCFESTLAQRNPGCKKALQKLTALMPFDNGSEDAWDATTLKGLATRLMKIVLVSS